MPPRPPSGPPGPPRPPADPPGPAGWKWLAFIPPRFRTAKGIALIVSGAFVLAALCGSAFGYFLTLDIPEVSHLQDWKPPVVTTLYSADGSVLYQFGAEKRIVIGLEQVPQHFIDALVATEDSRFFDHVGIDPWGIARAIIMDIAHLRKAQGGSTITQQLARSLFLRSEKTVRRKLQEMVLALQIEKTFTKNEILAFYCNQVYMGHGRYGLESAARYYFGKEAKDMSLEEAALLAGLVQRPEAYSPIRSPERAQGRRNHVLSRMVKEGKLAPEVAEATAAKPVMVVTLPDEDNIAPYFVEEVRRYLDATYGEVALYEEGLEVHTTLEPKMQKAANAAIFEALRALDKRQGLRPIAQNVLAEGGDLATFTHTAWLRAPVVGKLRPGLVTEVKNKAGVVKLGDYTAAIGPEAIDWTKKTSLTQVLKLGDVALFLVQAVDEAKKTLKVRLDQEPLAEGALLAVEPSNGEIKALVGGYDFNRSQFDRAVQAYRQAGSAFKPFVYTSAIDAGLTLADRLFDEPKVFVDPGTQDEYQPSNYYRRYNGFVTLREAMEESRNIVSVELLNQVGFRRTIELARRMGITSTLRPYPSLALGTAEVSLLDMVTSYSVFPNQGVRVEPHFIRYVADRDGKMREEAKPKVIEVIRADVAYVMTYLLEGVTESGTGAAAKTLNRPVAGKTGTNEDYADAWFIGFSPSLVAGVWVGFDQKKSLGDGETGARAALPAWIDFMKGALQGRPAEQFSRPANIVYLPIDRRTGLRATVESACPATLLEAFIEGTEPPQTCSPEEHFRFSLPYYLQKYPVNGDLELQIDADALVCLASYGEGEITLADGGKELILQEEGAEPRTIRLDIKRSDRQQALDTLDGEGARPSPCASEGTDGPTHFGVDGRPASIVQVKYD